MSEPRIDLEASVASIKSLADLLRDAASSPAKHLADRSFFDALRSQGKLAAYSNQACQIRAMSLNHQKRVATALFGEYSVLDSLRRNARQALESGILQANKPDRRTKQHLTERLRLMEQQHEMLLQDLFLLQRAYDIRCKQAKNYAKAAGDVVFKRCVQEQAELDATFSLRRTNFGAPNVVNISSAR